jgi:hypothetical protein
MMTTEQAKPLTIEEAEAQLQLAQAAERDRRRDEIERRKEWERAEKGWQQRAAQEVASAETRVGATFSEAADKAREAVIGHDVRRMARAWLRGQGTVAELLSPEDVFAYADPVAGSYLGAARDAGGVIERLCDVRADHHLDYGSELAQRLDRLECDAWRAFVQRVEVCAGER